MSQETVNGMEQANQARDVYVKVRDGMPTSIATKFKPSKPENLVRPTGVKPPPPKR